MLGHSGHGLVAARLSGGRGQQLELMHAARPLAVRRAQTIGARVAAADDDDVLVPGRDRTRIVERGHRVALAPPVRTR